MNWLLGSGALAGIVGMTVSFALLWRLSRQNRADLLRLVEMGGELRDARAQLDAQKRAVEERDAAISTLQSDLAQERVSRQNTEAYIGRLVEDFAKSGDPRSAGEHMRRSLQLLREVSSLPGSPAAEAHPNPGPLHGAVVAPPAAASAAGDVSRSKRPGA